jgi:flagellar hook assembly protein FlgD
MDTAGPAVKFARAEVNGVMMRFTEELDPASAENPSNYINTAMPVTTAKLQMDSQSVFLTLTKYNKDSISNVIITNIKDRSSAMNSSGLKNAILIKSKPLTMPVKINCGGGVYKDYLADQEWNPSVEYGRVDATVYQNTNTIVGAIDPDVYNSELNGIVEYNVRVPNGTYTVILMIAENYFTAAGKRKFSVAVQGNVVVKDIDIFDVVGKGVQCLRVADQVQVTNGIVDVHFMAQIDNAILNGIIITPVVADVNENENQNKTPLQWNIGQNYPNPFNGQTTIPVEISPAENLTIRFYDTLGREVSAMPIGIVTEGRHFFRWNGTDNKGRKLASGAYYYVVQGHLNSSTKKLVFVQ